MKCTFMYDVDRDVLKYYFTANKIALKDYGTKYYYVFPNLDGLSKHEATNTVVFPNFELINKNEWLILAKRMTFTTDLIRTFTSYESIKEITLKNFPLDTSEIKTIEDEWTGKKPLLFEFIKSFFGKNGHGIFDYKLEIFLTNYGSRSSYSIPINQAKQTKTININVRKDMGAAEIASTLLSYIVELDKGRFTKPLEIFLSTNIEWYIKQNIVDFLMTKTTLANLFPNYIPTFNPTTFLNSKPMLVKSDQYLKKLGFTKDTSLRITNGNIYDSNNELIKGLSEQETLVLKELVINVNKVCSYEKLGDTLWEEEALDKFSMNAINKIVCRIRRKLRLNNQYTLSIKTKRNEGYILEC